MLFRSHSRPGVFSRGAITQNFSSIGADAKAQQLPPRDPATREEPTLQPIEPPAPVFPGTPVEKNGPA